MTAYTKIVEKDKTLKGLAGLQRVAAAALRRPGRVHRRPTWRTRPRCPTSTCCTCSSRKAVQAALMMARRVPAHRLQARGDDRPPDARHRTRKAGELAKVNPPIRPREDVEFLWEALLAGKLDWVVSDHACCRHETKMPKRYFGNIWLAKSGLRRHRVPAARAGERRHAGAA